MTELVAVVASFALFGAVAGKMADGIALETTLCNSNSDKISTHSICHRLELHNGHRSHADHYTLLLHLRQHLKRSLGSLAPSQGTRSISWCQTEGYRNGRSAPNQPNGLCGEAQVSSSVVVVHHGQMRSTLGHQSEVSMGLGVKTRPGAQVGQPCRNW